MIGALDFADKDLIVTTSRTKRSADFIALLRRLDERYAPRPSQQARAVVLVIDNGSIHRSKASQAALKARPWLTVEWLPKRVAWVQSRAGPKRSVTRRTRSLTNVFGRQGVFRWPESASE